MKTPLDNEEQQPSEEWAKLRHYVSSPKGKDEAAGSFEQNVVTQILLTSPTVAAPDNFEDEVMRRITAEVEPVAPHAWDKIVSALKSRTAAVIGIVALVTGSPTAPAGWTVTYSNVASPVEASSWAFTPAANNPASSGVDIAVTGVRFLTANPIAPGASVSLTFQAKVKPYGVAGALPAAGTINNFGTFDYKLNTGGDVLNKTTNVVPVDINKN